MYIVAAIGDLASFIPFVNMFSNPITIIALAIVGGETGLSLFSSNRIPLTLATCVAEEIPGVASLPLWTLRVYLAKREEAEEQKKAGV